ncbi:Ku protein [Streptosporangium lutulentum]|uniref:DNA end-binding protein Ku n=1 Tax=Streptosporangium lutulentum TaxID=1461250 RepID=A0ABT9Q513_9ACTN|nr:Ku protein [Streptosporangium lutulentum]MDP9841520.1 DNA end-binding protein Ku [Streptosporangium lutulentum]
MKATWKGTVSFGDINIPVALYKATEKHARDGSPVRRKRWREEEGRETGRREAARGHRHPDGRRVVLDGEGPVPDKKRIDVLASVDEGSIDPVLFGQAYYVGGTDPAADQWYVLFRDALRQSGHVAVTRVTLGARESLAVLRVHDDLLVLQTVSRPGEVRRPTGIAPRGDITVRPEELKMAMHLMDILSVGFDLDEVHDDHR